jgi:hypothetical protein
MKGLTFALSEYPTKLVLRLKIFDSVPADPRRYRYSMALDMCVNDESKVGQYSNPYRRDVEK